MTKDKEILDGIEKTLEETEAALDRIESAADDVVRRPAVYLAVGITVGAATGAGIAWFISKRHYRLKYERLAEQEISEAKAFYNRLAKDDLVKPADSAESDERGVSKLTETGERAVRAMTNYQGRGIVSAPEDGTLMREVEEEETEIEVVPVTSNVFDARNSDDVWDQDAEEAHRATLNAGDPYIISHMEYNENENSYDQRTFTYFAEDDVLVDDSDKPIDLIDAVVGEGNLTRFGHGTLDNRIVHIRNDKLGMDFEIVKNERSYSKEVLGIQHSDGPTVRKMRRDRE